MQFTPLHPNWITGFSDGESTFGVHVSKSKTHKLGFSVRVWFAVSQDERDLKILEALKNYFQIGFIFKDSGDRKVWVYKISSYEDINKKIIPFFDQAPEACEASLRPAVLSARSASPGEAAHRAPLLTTKYANYNDLKTVVTMMVNKEHLTQEGLNKIIKISQGMNTKRDYSLFKNSNPIITPNWLLGFVDAEGISHSRETPNKTSKLGYRVIVFFSIYQHGRDHLVLKEIQNFFGCGSLKEKLRGDSLSFEYKVVGINDLSTKIIPFFDQYNLITTKFKNYYDFRIILSMMINKEHLTHEGLNKIKDICSGMNSGSRNVNVSVTEKEIEYLF